MTITSIVLWLLVLPLLIALTFIIRWVRMGAKQQSNLSQNHISHSQKENGAEASDFPVSWEAEWKANSWEADRNTYKAIAKAADSQTRTMLIPAVSRILEASKDAAFTAYHQAREAGRSIEESRFSALEAYRRAYETKLKDEYWLAEWQKNAHGVESASYRAIADALEDKDGHVILSSIDAITRVTSASTEAAIMAYRQASENRQDITVSRKAAFEAYKTAFSIHLIKEKERQLDPTYVRKRIDSLARTQIQKIEQRMVPNSEQGAGLGITSFSGFLRPGENLLEVIASDERTLDNLGITPDQVADRLEQYVAIAYRIQRLARRGKLDVPPAMAKDIASGQCEISISQHLALSSKVCKGSQACPFEDETGRLCGSRLYGDTDFTLRNTQTNETLLFPGLIIHLIREHHFFEGSVNYRVDPTHICKILELQPGISYRPQWKRRSVWYCNQGTGATGEEGLKNFPHLRVIRDNPATMIELDSNTHLYVSNERCVVIAEHRYELPSDFIVDGSIWNTNIINAGVWGFEKSNELYIDL